MSRTGARTARLSGPDPAGALAARRPHAGEHR